MSKLHLSAKQLPFLVVALALAFLAIACAPQASSAPTPADPASAARWAAKPDATGHYYAGNPNAKLVIEEWGDLQ